LSFATHKAYPLEAGLRAVVNAAFILVLKRPSVRKCYLVAKSMKSRFELGGPDSGARDSSRYRILCADDNPSFLAVLKLGLKTSGFEVVTASHGVDALMQYKANSGNFGSIVTDNDMPHMSGLEFIRTIREIGFKGRIVVMSGNLTLGALREYQVYNISGFFTKPFEISLLAAMLSKAS
jgi:CheY-like chemotaxis protein